MIIGALEATLRLIDTMSPSLTIAARNIEKFEKDNKANFKVVGEAVGIAGAAVVAFGAAVVALGAHGADVADVARSFDILTKSVGGGKTSLDTLRQSVDGTVSDFELMKASNLAFSQGLDLSQSQMQLTGETARVLADRVGGDTAQAYEALTMAMATGMDRQLKTIGLNIDAKAATDAYAASLGKQTADLTENETITAKRNAILAAMTAALKESGRAELDFGDKIQQARVFLVNFTDQLGVAIADSPALAAGLDAGGKALAAAFGDDQAGAVQTIMGLIVGITIGIVTFGQVAVGVARFVVNAYHLLDVAFNAVMMGVTTLLSGVIHYFLKVAEAAAKLPAALAPAGIKEAVGSLKDMANSADGAAKSFGDQAEAALAGAAKTNAAFDKTQVVLGQVKGAMSAAAEATVKAGKAAAGAAPNVDKLTGAHGKATEAAIKHAKALAELKASMLGSDAQFKLFAEALEDPRFVSSLMANSAALIKIGQDIKNFKESGAQLTPLMKEMADSAAMAAAQQLLLDVAMNKSATDTQAAADAAQDHIFALLKERVALTELGAVIDPVTGLWTHYRDVLEAELKKASAAVDEHKKKLADLISALNALGQVFQDIGDSIGGPWGSVLSSLGTLLDSIGKKAVTVAAKIKAIGAALVSIMNGPAGAAAGALQGAMQGAAAGFQVGGGWGAAIGGVVGAVIGLFHGAAKAAEELRQRMAALNASIISTYGSFARFRTLLLTLLPGSPSLFNLSDPTQLKAAMDRLNQTLAEFDREATRVEASGGIISKAMLDVILRARQAGVEVAQLTAFVKQMLQQSIDALAHMPPIVTEADAIAQATIFSATFWAAVAQFGLTAAVTMLTPVWNAIKQSLKDAGIDRAVVESIFGSISPVMRLVNDTVTGPLVQGIDALNQALTGLANSGYMTMDAFEAFEQQAGAMYDRLIAAGVAPNVALAAIAPFLQNLLDTAQRYGLQLDANTQSLVDQATAAGITFSTDPQQQMVTLLEQIVVLLGGTLPAAMQTTTDSVVNGTRQQTEAVVEGTRQQTEAYNQVGIGIQKSAEMGVAAWQTGTTAITALSQATATTIVSIYAHAGTEIVAGADRDLGAVAERFDVLADAAGEDGDYVGVAWSNSINRIAHVAKNQVPHVVTAFDALADAAIPPANRVAKAVADIVDELRKIPHAVDQANERMAHLQSPGDGNNNHNHQGAAYGAIVEPSPSGRPYIVGEGGQTEVIAPVQAMLREIGAGIAAQGGAGGGMIQARLIVDGREIAGVITQQSRRRQLRVSPNSVRPF